jgi:hypothetical protein
MTFAQAVRRLVDLGLKAKGKWAPTSQQKSESFGASAFKPSILIFEAKVFSPASMVARSWTLLVDQDTEQLTFTECVFKDCNIDKLEQNEERGLYVRDNFFDRPLDERRVDFENKLAQALAARRAKTKWNYGFAIIVGRGPTRTMTFCGLC